MASISKELISANNNTTSLSNPSKPLDEWTDQELSLFIKSLGTEFEEDADKFIPSSIDGSSYLKLTAEELATLITDEKRRTRIVESLNKVVSDNQYQSASGSTIQVAYGAAFSAVQLLKYVIEISRVRWTEARVLDAAVQLSEALSEMHKANLIHRELTTENISMTPYGDIKLLKSPNTHNNSPTPKAIPIPYRAPEILDEAAALKGSKEADIYALGCVLYAIAVGSEPWAGAKDKQIIEAITSGEVLYALYGRIDPNLVDVINRCLHAKPNARPLIDQVAHNLRNIRDSLIKKPLQKNAAANAAPITWGFFQDTNFGNVNAGTLSSRYKQPMSDSSTLVAREKFCESLGNLDPYMILAKRADAPSFYVVHRPPVVDPLTNKTRNRVAIITNGLWDPDVKLVKDNSAATDLTFPGNPPPLPGIELLAEGWEDEMGGDMSNSWLYQCLKQIACNTKQYASKVSQLLKEKQYVTMEVAEIPLPPDYLDPASGNGCMLLGIDSPTVPKCFQGPKNEIVPIITARLLNRDEWRESQETELGKKSLAERFNKDGTHHYSSVNNQLKPVVNANAAWSVKRLIERKNTFMSLPKDKLNTLEAFGEMGEIPDYSMFITLSGKFEQYQNNELATILLGMTRALRKVLVTNPPPPERLKTVSKLIFDTLETESRLHAWHAISEYIHAPLLLNKVQSGKDADNSAPLKLHHDFTNLKPSGIVLLRQLIQRIDWIVQIYRRENAELTMDTLLYLIGSDTKWMTAAKDYMTTCESTLSQILEKNRARFQEYRTLQRALPYPHGSEIRAQNEKAGFRYEPMMVYRDRMVCKACDTEIAAWRPWYYDVRSLHDFTKHDEKFKAELYPNGMPNEHQEPITAVIVKSGSVASANSAASNNSPAIISAYSNSASSAVSSSAVSGSITAASAVSSSNNTASANNKSL